MGWSQIQNFDYKQMIKKESNKKILLLLLPILLIVILFSIYKPTLQKNAEIGRANTLANAYKELDDQIAYKAIEIGKPTLLYDGTKITIYDIQIFQPQRVSKSSFNDHSKYLAVAFDVEFNVDKKQIYSYSPETKGVQMLTSKEEIDAYFRDGDIISAGNQAHNPYSMKWLMEAVPVEMRLVDNYLPSGSFGRLQSDYVRLAHEQEGAQPNIFKLWREKQKKVLEGKPYADYSAYPKQLRGWVTYIFRVDDAFVDDKVDYTFGEGLFFKYKNASANLEDLLKELGKLRVKSDGSYESQ